MRISWTTTPPTKSWETLKGKLWYCAKIKSWDFNVVTKLKLIAFVKMWVISLGQCVVPKHELLKLWLDPLLASAQLDAILINFISFWGFSSLVAASTASPQHSNLRWMPKHQSAMVLELSRQQACNINNPQPTFESKLGFLLQWIKACLDLY